jgi:hypothetical protein
MSIPPAVLSSDSLTFTNMRSPRGLTVETLKETVAIQNPPNLGNSNKKEETLVAFRLVDAPSNVLKNIFFLGD